jgi:hypothetical protein
MARISACVCGILLLVCSVVPALPQQAVEQPNEIQCTGAGTTCKTSFVPKFANNGGSATVNDSIMSQTGANIKIAGTETVTGSIHSGGTISAAGSVSGATLSGNGAAVTNVNAALLNGFGSGAFAFVNGNNTFSGSNAFTGNFSTSGTFNFFSNPIRFTDDGVSGDLQQPLLVNAVDCCTFGDRMIWAHSPSFGTWGLYYDDNNDIMRWQQGLNNGTDQMVLNFITGELDVLGAITAGVKDFKIDHPLNPKNKYLYHSSVESSEMMNIYTGNAILNSAGEAVVSLPEWFEALNTDFRYQLTAIGAPSPGLYIAQKIVGNRFAIAGGAPGVEVSWQVTGIRHDAYAQAHPLAVEVNKSKKERGHYLHPEAFGAPQLTQEQLLQQRPKP